MDSRRFDAFTRRVGGARLSRAAALRSVGAGALSAVLAAAGVATPGEAKHRKKKKPVCVCSTADAASCTNKKVRKKQIKKLASQACNYAGKCQPGAVGAQCRCPSGQTRCEQTCVNLQSDTANCGTCGTVCAAGLSCEAGTCCLPATANLQAAIDAAAAGSTLVLCAGTWSVTSTVQIGRDLTLVGAGAGQSVLDGNDAVRVLRVADGATVAVRDLTITHGMAVGSTGFDGGGGIFNEGTLGLRGVTVTGNRSNYAAGGINNAGTLTLQDGSRVSGNSADDFGGGIASAGTLTLQAGSRVAANSSTYGGGIYNVSGTVTLEAGSLIGGDTAEEANSATNGGGIYNNGGSVTLEATSRIAGNRATSNGGGIYNDSGMLTLQAGSRVTGNSANYGGGISNFAGVVTLQDGALVCGNTPANNQCDGVLTGVCPYPAETCPSD